MGHCNDILQGDRMKYHGSSGIYQATDDDGAECLILIGPGGWRAKYARPVVLQTRDEDGDAELRSTVEAVTLDSAFGTRAEAAKAGCAAYRASRPRPEVVAPTVGVLDRVYAEYPASLGVPRE